MEQFPVGTAWLPHVLYCYYESELYTNIM